MLFRSSLFWRAMLIAPFFWVFGFTALLVAIALYFLPWIAAIYFLADGQWAFCIAALLTGFLLAPHTRRLLAWLLQGVEYS